MGSIQPALLDEPPKRGAPLGAVEGWLSSTGRFPAVGLDEVGRGPLAGPVVAAAVVLPPGPLDPRLGCLNDSKLLSESRRETLFPIILDVAIAVGVGQVDALQIDQINILQATWGAMRAALAQVKNNLGEEVATVLVDGHLPLPGYRGEQWALIKGDSRSLHIAAASVVAKVTRDRQMIEWAKTYPGYGFERHKGYGTLQHRTALTTLGPCPLHRRSFRWSPVVK